MSRRDRKEALWARDEIASPCINICVIHPAARICAGCYRSMEEIAQWSRIGAEERTAIMAELPDRAKLLKKRRGGRTRKLAGKLTDRE